MQTEKQRERLVELIQEGKSHAFCDICEGRSDCENCENERLADYLMSNNVVVLPCNVNDVLYVIATKLPCYACKCCSDFCHKDCKISNKTKLVVKRAKVDAVSFLHNSNEIHVEIDGDNNTHSYSATYYFDDFGKTVFLSREEAENVLKERNNEK